MNDNLQYLVRGPIETSEIATLIAMCSGDRSLGAYVLFLGRVRADIVGGKRVREIVYTAYEDMAEKEAVKIKEDLLRIYDDLSHLEIRHSIGPVKAGEISLLVFTASGHREQAFQACRETIERIKQNLPIWKKEVYEDETHEWKEG